MLLIHKTCEYPNFSHIDMGQGYNYFYTDHFRDVVKQGASRYLPPTQTDDELNLMIGQARCLFNATPMGSS